MNPLVINTKSSNFLHITIILGTLLLSGTNVRTEEPATPENGVSIPTQQMPALDLSKENAAFDAFWDQEFANLTLDQIIKKIEENPAVADTLAELSLSCKLHSAVTDNGSITQQCHFCDLPKDIREERKQHRIADFLIEIKREAVAQEVQALIDSLEKPQEKPAPADKWGGLTARDLIELIPVCYISGRQVRDAGVPGFDEIVSLTGPFKIIGDIALGYCSNMIATICHEAGHSIAYRALYGKWPEKFTIGSSNSDAPALLSVRNGAIALRGLNPLTGVTTLDSAISFKEARSIPFLAAGGICGIAGYYGFKKLVHSMLGKKFPNPEQLDAQYKRIENKLASFDNSFYKLLGLKENTTAETIRNRLAYNQQLQLMVLPLMVDVAVWYELKNVLIHHEVQGTDASGIAIAVGHQFDKAWAKIVAKIKQLKHKKSPEPKKQ